MFENHRKKNLTLNFHAKILVLQKLGIFANKITHFFFFFYLRHFWGDFLRHCLLSKDREREAESLDRQKISPESTILF